MPALARMLFGLACLAVVPAFPADLTESGAREALAAWRKAGCPAEQSSTGGRLREAAIHAGRPDLVEQLLAGGLVRQTMLALPRRARRVPLHTLRTFRQFPADLNEEMLASLQWGDGWLARRITADRIEVWTSRHGWLFDKTGRLLHEARPVRRTGTGRQWYGAFLPDGQWVTTDLDEFDGTLAFFSPAGKLQRALTCAELAPPKRSGSILLGWARSDQTGAGWVVSVGSEDGYAKVWVGPHGPARLLGRLEPWKLCYPRALGPRFGLVPDDEGRRQMTCAEAGHGPGVGYPTYSIGLLMDGSEPGSDPYDYRNIASHTVPHGNPVFGFWPAAQSVFVGSDGNNADESRFPGASTAKLSALEPGGIRTRKYLHYLDDSPPNPIIDKTWLFDAGGNLTAWIRARRIADAADGRAMLFRVSADSRIVTLEPNLKVREMRRFVWKNGTTADAVTLWDDLRMGLFIRNRRVVLARW